LWIIERREAAIRRERERFDNEARRWRFDDGADRSADVERKFDGVGNLLSELIWRSREEKRVGRDFEV
jgi:hypothetical protein